MIRSTKMQPLSLATCCSEGTRPKRGLKAVVMLACATVVPGCINVTAPEEPIVIELNVNIRQEVIYRLAADANNLIDENEDIF